MTKEPYQVRYGGLMRCCLASLDEHMVAANAAPAEGDTLACKYCASGKMIFRDGAWEWIEAQRIRDQVANS